METIVKKPAVRPRDAASLVLINRDIGGEPAVLMGRRPQRQSFMPDVFVFPGGAVDRGDARTAAASELRPEVAAVLAGHCPVARGRALGIAAIRETFEETGLFLGTGGNPSHAEPASWTSLMAAARLPRLDTLGFLARAITPPSQPRRFHARFFIASASHLHGTLVSNGELLELNWYPLSRAYNLPIAPITALVLHEASRAIEGAGDDRGTPVFSRRHGKRMVSYDLGNGRVLRGLFEGSSG
ncbi:MAG: NUDIX hydrolase [Alphaproteobacteria bacterium]|nr:NUDIX hydrolase [Alphaproteobacteria bacterium]